MKFKAGDTVLIIAPGPWHYTVTDIVEVIKSYPINETEELNYCYARVRDHSDGPVILRRLSCNVGPVRTILFQTSELRLATELDKLLYS